MTTATETQNRSQAPELSTEVAPPTLDANLLTPLSDEQTVAGVDLGDLREILKDLAVAETTPRSDDEPFPLLDHLQEIRQWASSASSQLQGADPLTMQELATALVEILHTVWKSDEHYDLSILHSLSNITSHDSVQAGIRDYISARTPVSQYVNAPPSRAEIDTRHAEGFDMSVSATEEQPILRKLKIALQLIDQRSERGREFSLRELTIDDQQFNEHCSEVAAALTGLAVEELDAQKPFEFTAESLKPTVRTSSFYSDTHGVRVDIACVISPFEFEPLVDLQHKFDGSGRRQGQGGSQQIAVLKVQILSNEGGIRSFSGSEIREALGDSGITQISPPNGDTVTRGHCILHKHPIAPAWLRNGF
jgi:hypothetical protein